MSETITLSDQVKELFTDCNYDDLTSDGPLHYEGDGTIVVTGKSEDGSRYKFTIKMEEIEEEENLCTTCVKTFDDCDDRTELHPNMSVKTCWKYERKEDKEDDI